MNNKITCTIFFICLLVSTQFCRASGNNKTNNPQKDSALQVYLPREVTVEDDVISLGQVSIIRGEESLVAKASEIALGRISMPGQEIVLGRPIILSRLVCSGIPAPNVTLSGAEKITIKRQQQIIKGEDFVKLASTFLEKNPPAKSICQSKPLWLPKDLTVPAAGKDIKLSPRLAKSSARNQAKVRIVVFQDGKEIGSREVTFRLKYNYNKVVTLVDIPAGMVITPENVKIEKTSSNYPQPANWIPPYGLLAKRRLPVNTVIHPDMIGPLKPAVIVKRNSNVIIRLERLGLLVTAIGKATQDGRVDDYIKVRNVDSQRIILAKVKEDGTVEPVL
jgi:flagella basal body P-ring formation protein FlgA